MFASVALALLTAAPASASASTFTREPPAHLHLVQTDAQVVALGPASLKDAPITPGTALLASAATSLTGFVSLVGFLAVNPETALHWRLSTALFLLSVGPSVGDLLAHDVKGFLLGAGGRSLLAAAVYGTTLGVVSSTSGTNGLLLVGGLLFATMAGIVWTGWSLADMVRAYFAPQRWVARENERRGHLNRTPRRRPPSPIPGEPGIFRM